MTEQQCARCRTANPPEAAFCHGCGAALAAPVEAPRAEAAPSGWALATAGMGQVPEPVSGFGPLRKDELAGWWARLGASILDGLFAVLAIGAAAGLVALVGYLVDPEGLERGFDWLDEDPYGVQPTLGSGAVWLVLIGGALIVGYLLWEVAWIRSAKHMARPGQSIAGFRVVRLDGLERLSLGRSIGRTVAKFIYNVPNIGFLGSIATAFTIGLTERRQGLHDMIGGTVCVRKDALARRGIGPDAGNQSLVQQGAWRAQSTFASAAAAPGFGVPNVPRDPAHGTPPPGGSVPPAPAPAPTQAPTTPPPAPGPEHGGPFV